MKNSLFALPVVTTLAACGGSSMPVSDVTNPVNTSTVPAVPAVPSVTAVPAVPAVPAVAQPTNTRAFTTSNGALSELETFTIRAENTDITPVSEIPVNGSAEYNGVIGMGRVVERFPGDPSPEITDGLIGEMSVDVNFRNNSFTGGADNFFDENQSVLGSVDFENGVIERDPTGVILTGDMSGFLPFLGQVRRFDGGMLGSFAGDDAEMLGVVVFGETEVGQSVIGAGFAD